MKKALLIIIFTAVSSAGYAQAMKVTDDRLDKEVLAVEMNGPTMANLEMTQELNLSEEQLNKVKLVNEQRFAQLLEAERTYAGNDALRSSSKRAIHVQYDQKLKDVLNEQQMRHFLELEGRFHMMYISENEAK